MQRLLVVIFFLGALGLFAGPAVGVADACPMCKAANETEDAQPKAYMYSILFMLAVPATICSSLGFGLYRMSKKEEAAVFEFEQNDELSSSNPSRPVEDSQHQR